MNDPQKIGERLVATLIDHYAVHDPSRIWACVPVNNNDISQGFKNVTHAALWLREQLDEDGGQDHTIAYAGSKDLRYPVFAVAALKVGRRLLLCSPLASAEAQNHLLASTGANKYFYGDPLDDLVGSITSKNPDVSGHKDQGSSDDWLIFHTSGTTGLPKPIVCTNWMMTSFDAADLMPDVDKETMNDQIRNSRFYISLPQLHFVGMTATLQWTTFLNMILITAPPGNKSSSQIQQTLVHSGADGALMAISQIEGVSRELGGIDILRGLTYLYFVGAPIAEALALKLVGHVKLQPGMGTTEAGGYLVEIRNEDDWKYYKFRDSMGVEMQHRADNLYELVFRRQPHLARWQQLFYLYPTLDEFPSGDLWSHRSDRADLWKYEGRTDDSINLYHGEKVYTAPKEAAIQRHPDVKAAIVVGAGKTRPFALIELNEDSKLLYESR